MWGGGGWVNLVKYIDILLLFFYHDFNIIIIIIMNFLCTSTKKTSFSKP